MKVIDARTGHPEEMDVPPAGTPCVVCKAMGHFCAADQYTAGDSGNGICNACVNQQDCEVVRVRKAKPQPFSAEPFDVPISPARSIPIPADAVVPADPPAKRTGPKIGSTHNDSKMKRERAAEMLKDGVSGNEISRVLEISPNTVVQVRGNTEGVPEPVGGKLKGGEPNRKKEKRKKAVELLSQGKTWLQVRDETGLSTATIAKAVRDCDSNSPVVRGQRSTYIIPQETRAEIANESVEIHPTVLAKKYGCSTATINNIRRDAGMELPPRKHGPAKKQELVVTTPVTIVTVPKEPTVNITMSRAFEMVIREMQNWKASIADMLAEDFDNQESVIKDYDNMIGMLQDSAPQFTGLGDSENKSQDVYERTLKAAKIEEHLCLLELQRLTVRHEALKKVVKTLEETKEVLKDTR